MTYLSGTPGFDIECLPVEPDSLTAFDLYLSVPYSSLIFEKMTEGFRARFEISARLSDRLGGAVEEEIDWPETTTVERYQATQSSEPIVVVKRVQVAPGSYRVDVSLEDLLSGKKARVAQGLTLPDPADPGPSLGRITLLTGKGPRIPQISFFVKEQRDSLLCAVDAYNLEGERWRGVRLSVIRFPADTTIAQVPYWFNVMPLPLGHGLIDFSRSDTVSASRLERVRGKGLQRLGFLIPPLRKGMYRFDAEAEGRGIAGGDTVLSASRYYSVRGPGYPRPVTYGELLAAATYLMTLKEAATFHAAATVEEQKKQFESFWLTCGGGAERASALIKKYYGRVEEANRLFTTTREGWKSDRGLLYCVLGPPSSITNQLETQTWYYDLTGNAADNTYVFKRIIKQGEGLTVEDYILYRQSSYENFWTRMLSRWRSGDPL